VSQAEVIEEVAEVRFGSNAPFSGRDNLSAKPLIATEKADIGVRGA
jgi:hypothetical protein